MSVSKELRDIRILVWTALFAALIPVGAWISIPVGPVPITMQTLFIMLAGFLLGPVYGVLAVLLYIGAGCIGLPVFAGGKSGIATLWGPTGGYLVSYAVAVYITACKDKLPKASLAMTFALCLLLTLAAEAVILGAGGAWCGWLLGYSPAKVFSVLVLPFLPGDIAKDIAAVGIYLYLRKHGLLPR